MIGLVTRALVDQLGFSAKRLEALFGQPKQKVMPGEDRVVSDTIDSEAGVGHHDGVGR